MVYTWYNEILLSNKLQNIDAVNNMDKSPNNYAKPNQIQRPHIVWFYSYKILENANKYIVIESDLILSGVVDRRH